MYSYDTGNHLIQGTATTGGAVQYQYDVAGNVVGVMSVSPTALTIGVQQGVTIGTVGQAALLTFNASAGESVTLNLGSITTVPGNTPVTIGVYDSTGALIGSVNSGSSTTLTVGNLAGGAYTVIVSPQSPATVSLLLASTGTGGGSADTGTDAPMPLWAYIALGGVLLWIGAVKARGHRIPV